MVSALYVARKIALYIYIHRSHVRGAYHVPHVAPHGIPGVYRVSAAHALNIPARQKKKQDRKVGRGGVETWIHYAGEQYNNGTAVL